MFSQLFKHTLLVLVIAIGAQALTNYKLPVDFKSNLERFLTSHPSDSISTTDLLLYIAPILRGSVERHDRELMSAIVRNYFDVSASQAGEAQQISKSHVLNKVEAILFEEYINTFAMKMYRHLVELYDITDDINEEQFAQMIEDPELYGLIWEDYLIMTENVEELLLETEYDKADLEKTANELNEMWEVFKQELEKPDKVEHASNQQQTTTTTPSQQSTKQNQRTDL